MKSKRAERIYALFSVVGSDIDVPIALIYKELKGRVDGPRDMHTYVGSYISRLNRMIAPDRVIPGRLKRTYRLVCPARD